MVVAVSATCSMMRQGEVRGQEVATEWRGEVSGEGRRGPDAAFAGRSRAAASPYVDARDVAAADGKGGEGGVSGGERSEWMERSE